MKYAVIIFLFCFVIIIISGCETKESTDEINVKRNNSNKHTGQEKLQNIDSSEKKSSGESLNLKTITSKEVKLHIGDSLNIEGYVADIYLSENVAYLNFENKFPKNIFMCTIFSGKIEEFGDLSKFKGKNVRVTGKITSYKNKPQVVLHSKDQLKIIN